MVIWGVCILSLCVFSLSFGASVAEYSSMFQLGSTGLSISTILQFLFFSFMINTFKVIFFSDIFIKNLSTAVRYIMMFICIIICASIFITVFKWFPVYNIKPWIIFILCFSVFASVSILVSCIKEKIDNKNMQEALERMKETKF